jgi:hypothetical protein
MLSMVSKISIKLHSSGCVIYFVLMKISILSRILVYSNF